MRGVLIALCLFFVNISYAQITIKGSVFDKLNKEPLSYATITIKETTIGTVSDISGGFKLDLPFNKEYTLLCSYLGYENKEIKISTKENISNLKIYLEAQNIKLQGVTVIATERKGIETSSAINRMAMQHLQPSGVGDLIQLLPGANPKNGNYSQMSKISLRQAGNDNNTALGALFVIDGAPLNNDLNRQLPAGGAGDIKTKDRYSQNRGVDMREISTDEIETIEVIRGIPSSEYGDLTSGMIKITRKTGKTPLHIRLKSNLTNKLFYAGKGWMLKNGGQLNIGSDLLLYKSNPRNPLEQYQRITFSVRYKKATKLLNKDFNWDSFIDYTGTIDKEKEDKQQLTLPEDSYTSTYNKISSKLGFKWNLLDKKQLQLKGTFSVRYSSNILKRTRAVSLKGPTPSYAENKSGRYRGTYLPQSYVANHNVEGKPFVAFSKIILSSEKILKGKKQKIKTGIDINYNKNFGNGQIFDINAPLFYERSARPYTYKSLPAMSKFSWFAETNLKLPIGQHTLSMQLGLRTEHMLGIDYKYSISNKWYIDPRINISWGFPKIGNNLRINIYAGYGVHSKFPTHAHLYPRPIYYDIKELDYYPQKEEIRSMFYLLRVIDKANYNLTPSRNRKNELGIRLSYKNIKLDITAFNEKNNNGFGFNNEFLHINYKEYNTSHLNPENVVEPPDTTGLPYENKIYPLIYGVAGNQSSTQKQGIEYQLVLPHYKSIATRISVSGAWFKTTYRLNGEYLDKPSIILNSEEYPYIGVYQHSKSDHVKEQLNSSIRFDTHIPRLSLIFSNQFYIRWYYKRQNIKSSGSPIAYIDQKGIRHTYGKTESNNPDLRWLKDQYSQLYFTPDKEPYYITLNQKVTKEIKKKIRISFYINSLLAYQPSYKTKNGISQKSRFFPSFGAEINIKL